ncbi:MAG: repeat protein [Acidobacteriaceae bacterium]|nr:repeat protein [Acidobacteriaceae bacterium]
MQSRSIFRAFLFLTTLALVSSFSIAQVANAPGSTGLRPADVEVRITYENERPADGQIRVDLLASGGAIVAQQFTRDQGQVTFHSVFPGNYRLRVSGIDIEDNSETTFAVESRESVHFETVRVKTKKTDAQQSSNQGNISAAVLNIPDKARKEFEKGVSSMSKNDMPEAQKHFSKATEIYPQYAGAYNNLGVIAMKSGSPDDGKKLFEQAVRADANNAGAYVNLARCLVMKNNFSEALPLLEKASALSPMDPEALTLLANAQLSSHQLDVALANARKVHTMEHQRFTLSHLIAARVLVLQDKLDEAAAEYRTFLKESPESPKADNVRAAIESIEKRQK